MTPLEIVATTYVLVCGSIGFMSWRNAFKLSSIEDRGACYSLCMLFWVSALIRHHWDILVLLLFVTLHATAFRVIRLVPILPCQSCLVNVAHAQHLTRACPYSGNLLPWGDFLW
jgi:hypothetical protein